MGWPRRACATPEHAAAGEQRLDLQEGHGRDLSLVLREKHLRINVLSSILLMCALPPAGRAADLPHQQRRREGEQRDADPS